LAIALLTWTLVFFILLLPVKSSQFLPLSPASRASAWNPGLTQTSVAHFPLLIFSCEQVRCSGEFLSQALKKEFFPFLM
uniref:Uncharacterized protein n=3 Tax=Haplochromini TaxID=319058 RepID=A0A3B4GCJ7_9CICH